MRFIAQELGEIVAQLGFRTLEEMVGRVDNRGVQIHGGAGYINEYPVERFYRDARLLRLYEGTSQIQQVVIARELLRQD